MLTLLHLLSSIALLVWGTHIVRTGIMRVYGSHLRRALGQSMGNAPLAFGPVSASRRWYRAATPPRCWPSPSSPRD